MFGKCSVKNGNKNSDFETLEFETNNHPHDRAMFKGKIFSIVSNLRFHTTTTTTTTNNNNNNNNNTLPED